MDELQYKEKRQDNIDRLLRTLITYFNGKAYNKFLSELCRPQLNHLSSSQIVKAKSTT
jgi:hypothetical protein